MSSYFIFLASPYSHPEISVRLSRFVAASRACSYLAQTGLAVYSPIVHWHDIALAERLPFDADFWLEQNRPFIEKCDRLYVLTLAGWEKSVGVTLEIAMARALDKPVIQFPPVPGR